tara:strand:+ start:724 stop:1353 length:630 start_codon:yes stop_codon:yes gene_type:complete
MKKKNFPERIPVFPLSGVIYFPKTNLPLNIFENRYLELVKDCLNTNKLMGMVQSKKNSSEVYSVGCLGKISDYKKTNDGRVLINLTGLARFEIVKEINNDKLYREFEVRYEKFSEFDKNNESAKEKELDLLLEKTKFFFKKNGLLLDWNEFKKLNNFQQINTLSMIAPISNEEKQKLLEASTYNEKTKTFSEIIEFYLHDKSENKMTIQ